MAASDSGAIGAEQKESSFRFLIENINTSGLFVTLAAARLDTHRRRMVFSGAGHPPAMLARQGQIPVLLESRSMILGVLSDAVDVTANPEVHLEPDDRIVLYTDGITEVFNSQGQMLGISGVQEIVRRMSSLPADKMKEGILDAVAAWRQGRRPMTFPSFWSTLANKD